MRDLEKAEQPSRGYGFVDFKEHAAALAALRWANNNPALSAEAAAGGAAGSRNGSSDEWPRLIVEFAVENRSKLQVWPGPCWTLHLFGGFAYGALGIRVS
jgi:hypothetical protein